MEPGVGTGRRTIVPMVVVPVIGPIVGTIIMMVVVPGVVIPLYGISSRTRKINDTRVKRDRRRDGWSSRACRRYALQLDMQVLRERSRISTRRFRSKSEGLMTSLGLRVIRCRMFDKGAWYLPCVRSVSYRTVWHYVRGTLRIHCRRVKNPRIRNSSLTLYQGIALVGRTDSGGLRLQTEGY